MRIKLHHHLLIAMSLSVASNVLSADQAAHVETPLPGVNSSAANPAIPEDLGYDIFAGKTNKIARVWKEDPLNIYVVYEGTGGGRKISRLELPLQLAAKYPYDATRAAAFRQAQADAAVQQAAQQRAAARELVRRKEQEILAEITAQHTKDVEDQEEINTLKGLPAGNGRKIRLEHLYNEQQELRTRISNLKAQLNQVRAQRDRIP
jgi:hypothetical protein